jgi:hypothetical protein
VYATLAKFFTICGTAIGSLGLEATFGVGIGALLVTLKGIQEIADPIPLIFAFDFEVSL